MVDKIVNRSESQSLIEEILRSSMSASMDKDYPNKIISYDDTLALIGFGRFHLYVILVNTFIFMASSWVQFATPIATSFPNSGAY